MCVLLRQFVPHLNSAPTAQRTAITGATSAQPFCCPTFIHSLAFDIAAPARQYHHRTHFSASPRMTRHHPQLRLRHHAMMMSENALTTTSGIDRPRGERPSRRSVEEKSQRDGHEHHPPRWTGTYRPRSRPGLAANSSTSSGVTMGALMVVHAVMPRQRHVAFRQIRPDVGAGAAGHEPTRITPTASSGGSWNTIVSRNASTA